MQQGLDANIETNMMIKLYLSAQSAALLVHYKIVLFATLNVLIYAPQAIVYAACGAS